MEYKLFDRTLMAFGIDTLFPLLQNKDLNNRPIDIPP